jgi:glycyl-tRNA synthetase beta chain
LELLFEIGTEEIPATYIRPALGAMCKFAEKALADAGLECSGVRSLGTPRRLVLIVEGLSPRQKDSLETCWGPSVKAAYDAKGEPTQAAVGFAGSQGAAVADLKRGLKGKNEYVYVERKTEGKPAGEVLPGLLEALVKSLTFPKTMRWEPSGMRFARPIRWLTAVVDGRVVPLEIGGVTSGSSTRGHLLLANQPFTIESASEYLSKLEGRFVVVDHEARKKIIADSIAEAAASVGGRVVPDEELLERVTFMVEWPLAVAGSFLPKFLDMPRDVIVTALREHQDFFSVADGAGKLMPNFIAVANLDADRSGKIKSGNERVLNARLDDALFYWHEDLRDGLEKMAGRLENVLWQERLGSLGEKTRRVGDIAAVISEATGLGEAATLKRAALFSKADLTSQMVREKEFSGLQGAMGREYARASGEPEEVSEAIFEHYLPRFADDMLPESPTGTVLALADRLDTLVGCFGIGLVPSGSEDPYGLRRQATGVARILIEKGIHLPLGEMVSEAVRLYGDKLAASPSEVSTAVFGFMRLRLDNLLAEQGYSQDLVESVLDAGLDDPAVVVQKARALREFSGHERFDALATGFKRAYNITKGGVQGEPRAQLFETSEEKELHKAYLGVLPEFQRLLAERDFRACLHLLADLGGPIDAFFEGVMVMADDPEVRQNRLRLLAEITRLFLAIANLSKMETGR